MKPKRGSEHEAMKEKYCVCQLLSGTKTKNRDKANKKRKKSFGRSIEIDSFCICVCVYVAVTCGNSFHNEKDFLLSIASMRSLFSLFSSL